MISPHLPLQPASSPAQAHFSLGKAAAVLDTLLRAAPGLTPALLHQARVKFLSGLSDCSIGGNVPRCKECAIMLPPLAGEMEASQTSLQKCLKTDPNSTQSHLLMAQIQLHLHNPQQVCMGTVCVCMCVCVCVYGHCVCVCVTSSLKLYSHFRVCPLLKWH